MIETIATVESNRELAPGYRLLVLNFDRDVEPRAGQFAMLKACGAYEPLLRRALAIYRISGSRRASFLYQVLGRGTQVLSQLTPGSKVESLVPLGNTWIEPSAPECASSLPKRALVVAGGIGSASLFMLCEELKQSSVETRVLLGAANERAAAGCGLKDFEGLDLDITVTTDDGSLGARGLVTGPLERLLGSGECAGATIYACGPWLMMKRVAEIAERFEAACVVSLEAPMGCGFGVCVGCVVAIKSEGPIGYHSYERVCTDGPIFPAEKIRWDVNAMMH